MLATAPAATLPPRTPSAPARPPERLLSANEVADRLGIGRRTFYRLVARGLFPPGHRFSVTLVKWPERDVDDFIDQIAQARHFTPV